MHSGHFIAWARHPVDLGHNSSWMLQTRLRRVALIGGPIKIVVTCGGSYGRREVSIYPVREAISFGAWSLVVQDPLAPVNPSIISEPNANHFGSLASERSDTFRLF
jgi:hypothetical protein